MHHIRIKASTNFLAMSNMFNVSPPKHVIQAYYKNTTKFIDKITNNKYDKYDEE